MTGKKKSMEGGRLFGLLKNKPIFTEEHNKYLKEIQNLYKNYYNIKESKISVNNLISKVELFTDFLKKK